MNWTVFAIFAYLFVAMQQGLAGLFLIPLGGGQILPRFELVLVVFVALFAPMRTVLFAWAIVGVLIDLVSTTATGATLIGPHAIAYLAGGIVVLQLRTMVLRTHPLSHAFGVFCSALAVALVLVAIYSIRDWSYGGEADYPATADLIHRVLGGVYTAALAMVITWPLVRIIPVFGLQLSRTARR